MAQQAKKSDGNLKIPITQLGLSPSVFIVYFPACPALGHDTPDIGTAFHWLPNLSNFGSIIVAPHPRCGQFVISTMVIVPIPESLLN